MFIDKKEVLRYLGHRGQEIDGALDSLIETCIEETKKLSMPNYVYEIFSLKKEEKHIKALKSNLIFQGTAILKHLRDAKHCAVMAVTLGNRMEKKIRFYEKINLTKATILDACATTAVESLCDQVEKEIRKEAHRRNLEITPPFSPGYGDFPLSIQPQIIKSLETLKRIGLTCTEEYILIPRKSVTALIGFQDKGMKSKKSPCRGCNKVTDCAYQRGGIENEIIGSA